MIKVGILNADTPNAGELIRILINHPETEITTLYAPNLIGRNVSSIHHGMIGEEIVNFSDKIVPENLDILFITKSDPSNKNLLDELDKWEDLKIVVLNNDNHKALDNNLKFTGISEINRKNLVREDKIAYIPSPILVPALIATVPLARYMLLNSTLKITAIVPDPIAYESEPPELLGVYLKKALEEVQPSFSSNINFYFEQAKNEERVMTLKITFDCNLSIDEIEKIYEEEYDDHNFTFVTTTPVSHKEVEGTQKCVIYLNKPNNTTLEITVFADGRMRGAAGDAVHIMNLFTGLHEKTGLILKSSAFMSPLHESSSWFA